MLARTALPAPQPPCCTSASLRLPQALPLPLQQGRTLIVARASYSARSSSPRSDSWRSSWRDELEHGTNGNGNGVHSDGNEDQYVAHHSNGNGYHAHATDDLGGQGDDNGTWSSTSWRNQAVDEDSVAAHTGAEDDVADEPSGGGFFNDAFKNALKDALKRSPLFGSEYGGDVSGNEENNEPQPYESEVEALDRPIFTDQFRMALKESFVRQQTELDTHGGFASDDDEPTPVTMPYKSPPPIRREMSPIEEIISTALGASQLHLRRLTMMKNEIDAAIERETKQVERLDFALRKTEADLAYYKTLERMLEERNRN